MPKSGYQPPDGEHISLEQYLAQLKTQFSSVVVKDMATDYKGNQLENDVAIFVKR